MTVRFVTLGCKLNFAESSALGRTLLEKGHSRAQDGETADICVLNTCSVTDVADHKCRQALHRMRRENPESVLIVTGCYAQLAADKLQQTPEKVQSGVVKGLEDADIILGNEQKFDIADIVDRITALSARRKGMTEVHSSPIREIDAFHGAVSHADRTRCFLKVQDGCNYFCTYCTIPLARGKSRNPHIRTLHDEAQRAIDEGAREIVLTGVNIADFGRSTGETFADLLRSLDSLTGEYRLRIGSCEPNLLTEEIIDLVASSRHIAPHFHLPLQSGSNEVLAIMKRHYTREQFADRVYKIKERLPYAFIGVDCLGGVRGETEECFEDYLSFLKGLDVSQLHVFTYSERARTRMVEMDLPIVSPAERKRRSDILHEVTANKLQAFYAANKGRTVTVLWESKNSKGKMAGFTENYIRVTASYEPQKVNTFETRTL